MKRVFSFPISSNELIIIIWWLQLYRYWYIIYNALFICYQTDHIKLLTLIMVSEVSLFPRVQFSASLRCASVRPDVRWGAGGGVPYRTGAPHRAPGPDPGLRRLRGDDALPQDCAAWPRGRRCQPALRDGTVLLTCWLPALMCCWHLDSLLKCVTTC